MHRQLFLCSAVAGDEATVLPLCFVFSVLPQVAGVLGANNRNNVERLRALKRDCSPDKLLRLKANAQPAA